LGKLPLDRLRTLQLRVSSSSAQDVSFCIDEIWAEPRLSPREERYGLGTTPEQTAWKMRYSATNHPGFFEALARFLARGHGLAYVKGNHDVDMHWPLVQETFRDLVVEAGQRCPELGGTSLQDLRERIEFWPWVYYEPGLAYVEHGNQYEPANFFRDFLNPILPEDPQRLELPLGSFIVRYAFNSLETSHPWADNVKPASRYVRWLFKEDFFGGVSTILDNLGLLLRTMWQAFRKRAVLPRMDRSVLQDLQDRSGLLAGLSPEAMAEVVELSHARVEKWWRRILRNAALGTLSFVLLLGMVVLLIRPLLDLLRGGLTRTPWLLTGGQLAGSLALFLIRRLVARRLHSEAEKNYLTLTAQRIAVILNRHGQAVPYLVFGHTHDTDVVKLARQPDVPYDQWYVNTGTWTQVWSEEQKLVRESKQFAFFEILRDEPPGRPTLWQWNDDGGRPAPVLLLGE
jgi:UDP-2,3-diacylglucosamine pyrophosphatase LpxH